MDEPRAVEADRIPTDFIEEVCSLLAEDRHVRRKLPGGGLLNVDRLLPFLCVYRRNPGRRDAGTRRFVEGEAAYLTAPGDAPARGGLQQLVRRIAETAIARLGAFLIIEIWSSPDEELHPQNAPGGEPALPTPQFRIHGGAQRRPGPSVNQLIFGLERIHIHGRAAQVEVRLEGTVHPPGSQPLIESEDAAALNCFLVGLEILPIYRNPETGDPFPAVLGRLQRGVGPALKQAFFTFALRRTGVRPQHYFSLGRRTLPKIVWEVDHRLAEISAQFNLLLQATPVNAESSWHEFTASAFAREPVFHYRPLTVDPLLLKRQVIDVPTERIVDATLAHLFRQTQDELDRMATMLADVGTPKFVAGSVQVFGDVEGSLLELAREILRRLPGGVRRPDGEPTVDATEFAGRASAEIHAYRLQDASFAARAEVREDMYSGLMASGGHLLIGRETSLPAHRIEALLAHEIGTHLVTFYNGRAQPLHLLATGLAGYESLQEGLAVLAEFLVGGLTRGRLRMLAARVVAAHSMLQGAQFSETFRLLTGQHGFEQRPAYTITMRVYRGGGLTKDAAYLRGLVEVLDYLGRDGDLPSLLIGKIAFDHLPVVRELLLREVLRQPPFAPRFMSESGVNRRLERLRRGTSVLDLLSAEDGAGGP